MWKKEPQCLNMVTKEPTSFAVTTKVVNVADVLNMRGAMPNPTPSIREKFSEACRTKKL